MSRETEKTLQDFMNFLEKNGDGKKIGELADVYFGQGGNSESAAVYRSARMIILSLRRRQKQRKKDWSI